MADDIRPFLSSLPGTAAPRPFAAALPVQAVPSGQSPWNPNPTQAQVAEVEALKAKALTDGRAAGQRELDNQRKKLEALIGMIQGERDADATKLAELVANAAATVIEAWLDETSDRAKLFAPIVKAWLLKTGSGEGSIAKVAPSDVAAMRAAVGDAMIAVEADPKIPPGDVQLRGEVLDITHSWADRLDELKAAIATSMRNP